MNISSEGEKRIKGEREKSPSPLLPVSPSQITILIADDHPIFRKGLLQVIAIEPDLAIVGEAADGQTALEQIKTLKPEVAVLDIDMPKKNGFDVLSWWRTQSGLRRIPVIILTASMDLGDIERAFELGAHAFLVKPCDLNELTEMIRCLRDWLKINHFSPLNEWPRR